MNMSDEEDEASRAEYEQDFEEDAGDDDSSAHVAVEEPPSREEAQQQGDDGDVELRRAEHATIVPRAMAPASPVASVAASQAASIESAGSASHQRLQPTERPRPRSESRARRLAGKDQRRRSVLDQSPWTFAVRVRRIRGLRIPFQTVDAAGSAALPSTGAASSIPRIHDLRVFAALDKQPMQTRGSRWLQEPRTTLPVQAVAPGRRLQGGTSPVARGVRTGFLEEASWRQNDGHLEWTFSMDRFRRLKAYTPRIKLLVFGIGANAVLENVKTLTEDSSRENDGAILSLGWFFLDLRTPDLPERWLKLQNSPFGGEVLVSTTFTACTSSTISALSASGAAQRGSIEKFPDSNQHSRNKTGLDEVGDCLQLGDRGGSDVFILAVHIHGASQLSDLVHSKQPETLMNGFWLSYSLFDVVVQTDVFRNLKHPEFPAIRDSFRVKSCDEDLLSFIDQQRALAVYLCTENRILACSEIELDDLATSLRTKMENESALGVIGSVEGVFQFSLPSGLKSTAAINVTVSVECTKRAISEQNVPQDTIRVQSKRDGNIVDVEEDKAQVSEQSKPITYVVDVGTVRLEASLLTKFVGKEAVMLELLIGDQAIRHPVRFDAAGKRCLLGYCDRFEVKCTEARVELPSVSVSCCSSESDDLLAMSPEGTMQDGQIIRLPLQRDGILLGESILCPRISISGDVGVQQGSQPTAVSIVSGVTRRYRVSIHLKSARDFATSSVVSFSYLSPFTGKQRVETPVVTTTPKAEINIPDGQCTFEFFGDESQLRTAMESPVLVEMHSMNSDSFSDVVGSAVFSLNYLYFSEMHFTCTSPECDVVCKSEEELVQHVKDAGHDTLSSASYHTFKSCSIYLPLMGAGVLPSPSTMSRVGAIRVVAYLQDMGIVQSNDIDLVEKMVVPELVGGSMSRIVRFLEAPERNLKRSLPRSVPKAPEIAAIGTSLGDVGQALDDRTEDVPARVNLNVHPGVESHAIHEQFEIEINEWKRIQRAEQVQWKKRFAAMEKQRMDELEEEWARREEERSAVLSAAQIEYRHLEEKLRLTLTDVENRERKLALAEASLERDRRIFREDNEMLRKRMQSEQSHALALAQRQVEMLERRVSDLQTQLAESEKRAAQVETDFAEFRRQQRKVPESKLREEIASLNARIVELEKSRMSEQRAKEQAEASIEVLKRQLDKSAGLVEIEKKKNETRIVEELEKLRLKYIAREERYVLDGDREELRAIKKQLDELRRVSMGDHKEGRLGRTTRGRKATRHDVSRGSIPPGWHHAPPERNSSQGKTEAFHSPGDDASANSPGANAHSDENAPPGSINRIHSDRELRRLYRERDLLLTNGSYSKSNFLVRELDRLIAFRENQLSHQNAVGAGSV